MEHKTDEIKTTSELQKELGINSDDVELQKMIRLVNENRHLRLEPYYEPRCERRDRVEIEWPMSSSVGDFISILLMNGYEVTIRLKDELSKDMPLGKKPDKIAVIEFERMER